MKNLLKLLNKKTTKTIILIYIISFIYLFILSENLIFSLIISFLSFIFLPYINKEIKVKKEKKVIVEFQDFLYIFNSNLKAGKSIENSLLSTKLNLETIYFKESILAEKIERIIYLNSIGISFKKGFYSLEDTFNLGFFKEFGNVIEIAQNQGGSYIEILMETSNILGEKLEIEREIEALMAKQSMEVKILRIMPLALLLVLKFLYPELIVFLSSSIIGIITFLIVAAIMIGAIYISNKLMEVIW